MKFKITILCCMFSMSLLAQQEIIGSWKGILTQNEGGFRSKYEFELYLKLDGDKITGRSYVYIDDIFAEMDLEGLFLDDQTIWFQETKLGFNKILPGMQWCIKNGKLALKRTGASWKLEGYWEGQTPLSNCVPGKIFLQRVIPRV